MAQVLVPKRPLGDTGLQLSVLGFGAAPLGGVYGGINEEEAIASVHRAFELGINYFDSSPYYGDTKSETVLGRALKGLPREQVIISTKVGRYGESKFDFSAQRVKSSVMESLERLQTTYIDIILCHDIEFGDLDQVVHETLPALQELKGKGLVHHVGITGLPLNIFKYVIDRAPPGTVDVILSYCHYCLLDTTLGGLLPYLVEKRVGVVSASPYSMGLLTQPGPPPWHPAPEAIKQACRNAVEHAKDRGYNIAGLSLKFATRERGIASTLCGMSTRAMVEQNVAAVLRATREEQQDPAAAAELSAVAAESDDVKEASVMQEVLDILAPVKDTTWPSGRPENS